MWSRIQAQRAQSRVTDISWRHKLWSSPRLWVPAAAAAVLIIGISIGRFTAPAGDGVVPQNDSAATSQTNEHGPSHRGTIDNNTAYRMAATPVMKKAELLLAQFSAGDSLGENGDSFSSRATKLLTDTRLLLDSPAADDPELKRVLSDLELILTQIKRLSESQEQDERESIDENMKNRSLLPRLRATSPTGTFKITT